MTNPITDKDGNQFWHNSNKELHREDGPSIIWSDGSQFWYLNGKQHLENGPAYIRSDGKQRWYVNGRHVRSNKEFQKVANLTDEDMTLIILKYGNVE